MREDSSISSYNSQLLNHRRTYYVNW